jgi:hypothetical protein
MKMKKGFTDADMMVTFIRKLKPATQMQVELKQPQTLKQAYLFAKGCDPIIYQNRNLFGSRTNTPASSAPRGLVRRFGDEMDLDQVEERRQTGPYRSASSCFNCGKTGDFSRDCKAPKSDKAKGYEPKRSEKGIQQEKVLWALLRVTSKDPKKSCFYLQCPRLVGVKLFPTTFISSRNSCGSTPCHCLTLLRQPTPRQHAIWKLSLYYLLIK